MSERAPRLLFLPVSGQFGMGEYARALAIARGARVRWPDAAVLFAVSRQAPYAQHVPFATTLLDSSPTFQTAAVTDIIQQWRPDLVIFDNAGRTAQLRAARRAGARVVYISARPRQRRKAFRWRWLSLIDEHWIAYPAFLAGALGPLERCKLALKRRPVVRFLDVILAQQNGPLLRQGYEPTGPVLVVPGGGTGHPGASAAAPQFLAVANGLAAAGYETIFVGPASAATSTAPPIPAATNLRIEGLLPQDELAAVMRGARLVVANGGSTLLQAIACGTPCVAAAIAGDQRARIAGCERVGVVLGLPLDPAIIEARALALLGDPEALRRLARRAAALDLANGVEVAVQAITRLLARSAT